MNKIIGNNSVQPNFGMVELEGILNNILKVLMVGSGDKSVDDLLSTFLSLVSMR